MDKKLVSELEPGQAFVSFFAVRRKEIKEHEGTPFLIVELGDRTGSVQAVIWENFREIGESFSRGDVVKVKGTAVTYREQVEVHIDRIRKAEPGEVDVTDFLPEAERDRQAMYRRLLEKAKGVQNPHLRKVLEACFTDADLAQRFLEAPGGKRWHHVYLGGLLEHTLGVTAICERAAEIYDLTDRDLLVAGALLHDIGKTEEYQWSTSFDFSDRGRLEGHVVLGERMVRRRVEEIEGFPEELLQRLSHMILSHQGRREFGSPVIPMTLEAIILYYADELDAKAGAFTKVIKQERDKRKVWSNWVHLLERFIYLGPDERNSPKDEER